MGDSELIALIRTDAASGMDALMKQYTGLVIAVVKGRSSGVCTVQDTEECVSDVFFDFYRAAKSFDVKKGSIKAFLCTVARRRATDMYRRKAAELLKYAEYPEDEAFEDCEDKYGTEERFIEKEQISELSDAICGLPDTDREIIVRKYFFGEKAKSIGKKLSMSASAVDARASRAVEKLRKKLKGEI